MNKKWGALVLGAALSLAATAPARADLVTFDDIGPSIYATTDTFSSGGFAFEQEDDFGYGAAGGFGVVDGPVGFNLFGNAPTNATSQFYAGLNDGALTMTTGNDRALFIDGFEFSFIPAVLGFYAEGEVPGYLVALYTTFAGATAYEAFAFSGADADGAFAFSTIGLGGLGGLAQGLRSVTFFACVFTAQGCVWPAENLGQFALDNIYARVPEPGSLGLALLGLGLMAGVARRRRSN